jgi:hypothetical protein
VEIPIVRNGITFLGDVWLPIPINCSVEIPGEYVFNLEGPITTSETPIPGKINLKSQVNYIQKSFGKNTVAVCLSNNHLMDYGQKGYDDTIAVLRDNGIQFYGARSLSDNCSNPLILDFGGPIVGLLGYVCMSTSPV